MASTIRHSLSGCKAVFSLFLILQLLFLARAFSQDSLSQNVWNYGWFDAGIGTASGPSLLMSGTAFSVSHLSRVGLFTIRFIGAAGDRWERDYVVRVSVQQPAEFGLLHGRALRTDLLCASVSVGVGMIWGRAVGPVGYHDFSGVGIPFQVEAFVEPLPVLAFWGRDVLDINAEFPFSATLFCGRFGLLHYVKVKSPQYD